MIWETPGNNPFHFGLEEWCKTHGVHARPHEMLQYSYRNFEGGEEKFKENEDIRARYASILDYQLKKMSPEEKEKVDDFKEKEKMIRWHQLKQAEKRA